jgi:AraC-like DNA-binding protein
MKQDLSWTFISPAPRPETRLYEEAETNVDVRFKRSAGPATDEQSRCVSQFSDACFPEGSSSLERREPEAISQGHEIEVVLRIVSKIVELCSSEKTGNADNNVSLYRVLEAVVAIFRASAENNERWTNRLAPWQERAAKKSMTRDLACPPTLKILARECGMSKNSFVEAFRSCTGLPPRQWLISFRISRAQDMLACSKEHLSIIAVDCGFCDQSHFTRTFTRTTGVTPAAWRRQNCKVA